MGKHVQIREVPEDMHRALKMRAAEAGLSMSDYVKRILLRDLDRATKWDEIIKKMKSMPEHHLEQTSVEMIRELRGD